MRKIRLILYIAALTAAFTACGQASGAESTGKHIEINENSIGASASRAAASFEIINNGRLNCSNEDGYYYLTQEGVKLADGAYGSRMMYMDYATKQEIFLCNRPGCSHDTTECPAVFDQASMHLAGSLFIHEGFLYAFSHEQDQAGATFMSSDSGGVMTEGDPGIGNAQAALYRMNLDGTDRKKVLSFEAGLALEDTVLGGDGTLYFITKKLSGEQVDARTSYVTAAQRQLVKVDTQTWESSQICQLDTDWQIIGTWKDGLVISSFIFDHELTTEELTDENAYVAAFKNSVTQYSIFYPADERREQLLELPNTQLNTAAVHGGSLYTSTDGAGNIRRTDLESKETGVFVETNANQILEAYDDVLYCSEWGRGNASAPTSYFVRYEDGTVLSSNLVTETMGSDVVVRAELADRFLVIYDEDATLDTAYDNGQYSVFGYKYALIAKEDFYTGKAGYEPIAMIGFGE